MHDWKTVSAGSYHGFHTHWISELTRKLNNEILPSNFYAEPEQVAGQTGPDVLARVMNVGSAEGTSKFDEVVEGGTATLTQTQPQVTLTQTASEEEIYSEKRNRLAIRHTSGDRLVAYIELLSPGNKSSQRSFDKFLDKAFSVIEQGVHLLIVDPFPPGKFDTRGIHGAIWNDLAPSTPFEFPDQRRLTAVSYHAVLPVVAYVEPMSVGKSLPLMPLFLDEVHYVNLPLEPTYTAAFSAIPKHIRKQLNPS